MAEVKREAPASVKCRVTKKGAGKISTGEHVTGEGDKTFELNATFQADPVIAAALEDRDFVEILP